MRHLLRLLIAGTIALVAILVLAYVNRPEEAGARGALPGMDLVPDFRLVERGGAPIGRADLLGKVWIADFIFTGCSDQCPRMSERMGRVARALEGEPDVRLVSFSLDPQRDTPEKLAKYADGLGAPKERWLFATGPRADLERLSIEGFKLGAGEDAGQIIHSSRFVLVDRAGRIRGYYDGDGDGAEAAVRKLVEDARTLARERPAS